MDVPARHEQVGFVFDLPTPEASPEEVVAPTCADIECPGVTAVEFLHSSRQAAVADLQDQVVVVPHQAIRDYLPPERRHLGSEDE